MTPRWKRLAIISLFLLTPSAAEAQTAAELDAFWDEMARTVEDGDFEGYSALYHPDAVLVSLGSETSYPIAQALAGWEQGFVATKTGDARAAVELRFTRRLHDETTAHETGIFRYTFQPRDGAETVAMLHFEGLLVKKDAGWLLLMEFQQEPATDAEWEAAR